MSTALPRLSSARRSGSWLREWRCAAKMCCRYLADDNQRRHVWEKARNPEGWPPDPLDFDFAFEVEDALAFELGAIAAQAAEDFAAARRGLKCGEVGLAETLGPVWREHAVRGAGDGVFGDSFYGCEVAADEVVLWVVAFGSDDEAGLAEADEGGHVRVESAESFFVGEEREVVEVVFGDFEGRASHGFGEARRRGDRRGRAGGEIHDVAGAVF